MQIEQLYNFYLENPQVQTDTRQLKKGDLFFALKGPNFNGNQYATAALEMGAAGVVIDEPIGIEGDNIFQVEDGLTTLQALALHHRKQFNIPFLAITGSNGKTTTKELIHAVLSTSYKTYTTKGNLNNHIGVPLTILSIRNDAEMAIIEMGANHQKEIESYCTIALPTHGLITNCGKAHLEGFGGVEGIRKGKGELFDFIAQHAGTVFINSDLDYLDGMSEKIQNKVYYGNKRGPNPSSIIDTEKLLGLEVALNGNNQQKIFSQLVGNYNKANIDAAICVGLYFGISFDNIRNAIEAYAPDNARSQLIKKGNNAIILDAYNANPSSMQAAIENFAKMDGDNKFLFLGGMMELGNASVQEHQNLIGLIKQLHLRNTILVGGDFAHTQHPFLFFEDVVAASSWLKEHLPIDAQILIKGSRSMRMEKLVEVL